MRLMAGAHGSIKATSLPTGVEYVIYDPKQVKKIVVLSGWASPNTAFLGDHMAALGGGIGFGSLR